MNGYSIRIEVPEGEAKNVLERLQKAQDEIYECYTELENLGVLHIIPQKLDRE